MLATSTVTLLLPWTAAMPNLTMSGIVVLQVGEMAPLTWEWIAGFFDGEGCVSTCTNTGRNGTGSISASVSQSAAIGLEVLTDIKEFLGARGIKAYLTCQKHPKNPRINDNWQLRVMARTSVAPFLRGVIPYLRVKRVIADDTLRYLIAFPPV